MRSAMNQLSLGQPSRPEVLTLPTQCPLLQVTQSYSERFPLPVKAGRHFKETLNDVHCRGAEMSPTHPRGREGVSNAASSRRDGVSSHCSNSSNRGKYKAFLTLGLPRFTARTRGDDCSVMGQRSVSHCLESPAPAAAGGEAASPDTQPLTNRPFLSGASQCIPFPTAFGGRAQLCNVFSFCFVFHSSLCFLPLPRIPPHSLPSPPTPEITALLSVSLRVFPFFFLLDPSPPPRLPPPQSCQFSSPSSCSLFHQVVSPQNPFHDSCRLLISEETKAGERVRATGQSEGRAGSSGKN